MSSIEKGPEFRIVGGASPEKKAEAQEELQKALFNHFESLPSEEREKVAEFEYKKSEKEIGLIDFANQETNRLRQETGVEPYNIPYENYHLLPSQKYKEIFQETEPVKHTGTASYARQGILLDAEKLNLMPLMLGNTLLHETLHIKGHFAVEVEERDKEIKKSYFRSGVSAYGAQRQKYHQHFSGLNEAIVATQEKKSFPKMLNLPFYREEKEWLFSGKAKELRKELGEKDKVPEDEFIWVGKNNDRATFSYFDQRRVLDYVCAEIQKEHPQQYKDKEDVFGEFLKSHFTGRLMPLARLVEKTFGKGSFRSLGDMTTEEESAILHMESLQKARFRQQKKEKL